MKCYNIYYKGEKINRRPLTKNDIDKVMKYEKVSKIVNSSDIREIPTKGCKIVECTLI